MPKPKRAPTANIAAHTDARANAQQPPPSVDIADYDGWLERVRGDAASLLASVWVAEAGADGRSFGSRLGKVPLLPLEDLDERIRVQWPGPRVLILRTKAAAGGAIRHTARLSLAGDPPREAAPTGDAATLAALVMGLQRQVADLVARTAAPPPAAAPPLSDQVGALASVAQVVRSLTPGADPGARPGMTIDDVKALIDLGKRSAGDTSVALEALRMIGPAGVDFLKASAGMLLVKINDRGEKADK